MNRIFLALTCISLTIGCGELPSQNETSNDQLNREPVVAAAPGAVKLASINGFGVVGQMAVFTNPYTIQTVPIFYDGKHFSMGSAALNSVSTLTITNPDQGGIGLHIVADYGLLIDAVQGGITVRGQKGITIDASYNGIESIGRGMYGGSFTGFVAGCVGATLAGNGDGLKTLENAYVGMNITVGQNANINGNIVAPNNTWTSQITVPCTVGTSCDCPPHTAVTGRLEVFSAQYNSVITQEIHCKGNGT